MLRGWQIFVKTWPKSETTHEKSLALRVTSSSIFRELYQSLDEARNSLGVETPYEFLMRLNIVRRIVSDKTVPDRQFQETKKCLSFRYSTKLSRPPSSLIFLLLISWGSNYLSFWNLPSIVSRCTLLKIWIWSLCVSIFVWYNRMPTELQSVCSTETRAGLIGYQF